MVILKLREREIPLVYTTLEMLDIQEDIGPIDKAIRTVNGINPDDDKDLSLIGGKEQLKALGAFIRILGNAGLRMQGGEPDLKDREILGWMRPDEILKAVNACMDAMQEGMKSEIPEKEESGPIDVTLEEINKKKVKGN